MILAIFPPRQQRTKALCRDTGVNGVIDGVHGTVAAIHIKKLTRRCFSTAIYSNTVFQTGSTLALLYFATLTFQKREIEEKMCQKAVNCDFTIKTTSKTQRRQNV